MLPCTSTGLCNLLSYCKPDHRQCKTTEPRSAAYCQFKAARPILSITLHNRGVLACHALPSSLPQVTGCCDTKLATELKTTSCLQMEPRFLLCMSWLLPVVYKWQVTFNNSPCTVLRSHYFPVIGTSHPIFGTTHQSLAFGVNLLHRQDIDSLCTGDS